MWVAQGDTTQPTSGTQSERTSSHIAHSHVLRSCCFVTPGYLNGHHLEKLLVFSLISAPGVTGLLLLKVTENTCMVNSHLLCDYFLGAIFW